MRESPTRQDNDPFLGMSRAMLWVFWLLVLAGGTWLFSLGTDDSPSHPNTDPQSRVDGERSELRLQANRRGHYLADGYIDGHPVTFLLDTGATAVVVPAADAERMGLERGRRIPVRTASGQDHAWRTRIQHLELGPLQLEDVEAAIAPGLEGSVLLGMSALGQLELNQRQGVLVLTQYH